MPDDSFPTAEQDKFRGDLATTGKRYGLMVWLSSRLIGVPAA